MATLALDTATPAPSLALRTEERTVERLLEPEVGAGRRVGFEIHQLLEATGVSIQDVDRIVVGVGPGGFTGIRIGLATALALGQARGIPVVGVSSIEALGLGIVRTTTPGQIAVPVIDAKRREVFVAAYRLDADGVFETVAEPRAADAEAAARLVESLAAPGVQLTLAGDGLTRCEDVLGGAVTALPAGHPAHHISAAVLEERSRDGGARPVTPIYLRLPDAEVNRLRRAGAE